VSPAQVGVVSSADSSAGEPAGQFPRISGTRAGRVIGAVRVNYLYQAIVLIAGLWLTPFLVTHLGETDYGLWIAGTQIVAWLYVMDLGVVALVPREAAYAIGAAAVTGDASPLPRLIDRTMMLLLWQLPVVAIVTVAVWLTLPTEYERLAGPLLLVFATFVIGFPFRIFQAVLTGIQDLVYVSVQTSIGWTVGFLLTVGLVKLGLGLYALAFSFVVVQLYQFVASWVRLRTHHRHILPQRLTPLPWSEARSLLTSGTWVSVAQVAQVLLVGTDVVIITQLLGAGAVVPYAITGKLISVLANQPSTVIQSALPGISEIRGSSDIARLKRVASALGQAMLIVSCVVFCVVLVVNEAFVDWWGVPNNPYAGDLLTGLLLLAMVIRHANFSIVLTLFSLGGEKRISLTTLADGLVTVAGAIVLVPRLGLVGAPIASLLGASFVSLPANLKGLSLRAGVPVIEWLRPLWGWTWRFVLLAIAAALAARRTIPPTLFGLAATTIAVSVVVLAVMAPVALRPPLGTYLAPRLGRFRPRWL
jgi:O-antigen/teichoic acid export membrane protein